MVDDGQRVVRWFRMYAPRIVGGLAILTVAIVTGRVSYVHIRDLSLMLHQPPSLAWLIPFGVDGLIVVGSVVLLQSRGHLGWLCVGPGVAISLFANVESGLRYGALAASWAAVSAVSFALSTFTFERWLTSPAATVEEPGSGVFTGDPSVREGGRIAAPEPACSPVPPLPVPAAGPDPAPGGLPVPVVVPANPPVPPPPPVQRPAGGQGKANREAILHLHALNPDREGTDIAKELGLHPRTVWRHLAAANGNSHG